METPYIMNWWRTIHGYWSRAPRHAKRVKLQLQHQGKGTSIVNSTPSSTRVFIHEQARFYLSFGGRSRGDNFLHAPPSWSLGSHLSNKLFCSPLGGHLVGQPEGNPQLHFTGLNSAHPNLGFCLDNQINFKCHETLEHESTLNMVPNQGPKV